MRMILLTCVACGKQAIVRDNPEEKRNRSCTCANSMVQKRMPGSVL